MGPKNTFTDHRRQEEYVASSHGVTGAAEVPPFTVPIPMGKFSVDVAAGMRSGAGDGV